MNSSKRLSRANPEWYEVSKPFAFRRQATIREAAWSVSARRSGLLVIFNLLRHFGEGIRSSRTFRCNESIEET